MAVTEYTINHPMAIKLWQRRLARDAISATFLSRFVGTDTNSIVQRVMGPGKGAGDQITWAIRSKLFGKGVRGDGTLEGNEEALVTREDRLIVDQLRHAVRSAGRMSDERVPWSFRAEARDALSDWWAERMDTAFMLQMSGSPVIYDERLAAWVGASLEYTGLNPVTQPDPSRMVLANPAAANEAALVSTDIFNLGMLDRGAARAKTTQPHMRPARVNGGEYLVAILHPTQVAQLRQDNSAGSWKDIQMAALAGGRDKDNPLFTGALGFYNGIILHESERVPPASTAAGVILPNVRRAVLLGAQAGAIGFGQSNPTDPEAPFTWDEERYDYNNQFGVGAGAIFGLKKSRYRNHDAAGNLLDNTGRDFAVMTLSSYSPAVI